MAPLILGIHSGGHDAGAALFDGYALRAAVQLERLTRIKNDGFRVPEPCIDEVLAIAGATRRDVDAVAISRSLLPNEFFRAFGGADRLWQFYRTHIRRKPSRNLAREVRIRRAQPDEVFDGRAFARAIGLRDNTAVYFYDHHEAHALPALFYTDWDDALLVTADAGGDSVNYSHRHFAGGRLTTLYGGDDAIHGSPPVDSLGQLYSAATEVLGFRRNRHEGKVTGLAAMGEPVLYDRIVPRFRVDDSGRVCSDFRKNGAMVGFMRSLAHGSRREEVAASVQKVLEEVMLASVRRLLARHPARHLGVSGGVFANVTLNRRLAEALPLDEIFVVPPMGDEGLPMGGALAYLLARDGLAHWLGQRRRLDDVYLGRDHGAGIDPLLRATAGVVARAGSPVEQAAQRLAAGRIGAIYTGRMEYGPRALGARSILANPARRETHDLLNRRLDRTEFMPFAPVIAAEKCAQVFDIGSVNAYACRFMTITCNTRPEWRERIPAVVHVDGSARPQVIERRANPLYYDILAAFERSTGLPVLVNTSFNVHEEPIVNAPAECAKALIDGRIDFVVTPAALYECEPGIAST